MLRFAFFAIFSLFLQQSAFADPTRYLLMGKNSFSSVGMDAQREILRNLPHDVRVFYFYADFEQEQIDAFQSSLPAGPNAARIQFYPLRMGVLWTRDCTPELVRTRAGGWKLVSFRDDSLGEAFNHQVAEIVARELQVPLETSPLELQGGNILIDDQRELFTTDLVLEENPGLTRREVIAELKRALEVDQVRILPMLPGEMTGHIDTFVFYGGGKRAIVAKSERPEQRENLNRVADVFRQDGYQVDRLMISPSQNANATRSYTNSLRVNDRVFIPSYGHLRNDAAAVKVFSKLGLSVVPVNCQLLADEGGEVHCITKEYPDCGKVFLPQ
jgi:agmatine deiminase